MLTASPQIHAPPTSPSTSPSSRTRPRASAHLFRDRVAATPDRPAYMHAVVSESGDEWVTVTWSELDEVVREIGAGLIALGVEPEDRVAIASSTRYEWALADLATMVAGGATTTIYPTTMADDVAFILADSGAKVVFAENAEQLEKLRSIRETTPSVTRVVVFDGVVRHRRVDTHPRRGPPAGPGVPRGRPGGDRRADRRHPARPARDDHLHLGNDRPPQGGPAAPQRLDLRGRGCRRHQHPLRGRPAVPLAARSRTSSARCCSPCRCRSASPRPSTGGSTRSSTTSPS